MRGSDGRLNLPARSEIFIHKADDIFRILLISHNAFKQQSKEVWDQRQSVFIWDFYFI